MITIDGSYGEGGGQILRTAVALSAITGHACRVERIRAGRPKPGLQASHLTAIRAAAKLCGARLEGARTGSHAIEFTPSAIVGGEHAFDVGTAGAVTLVLQTLVPLAFRADSECVFRITGGTEVPWSPPMEYFEHVFCWWLQRMGGVIHIDTKRHGFYPKGGGRVDIVVRPASLRGVRALVPGPVTEVHVESLASAGLEGARVAQRQVEGFRTAFGGRVDHRATYAPTYSPGSAIHAHAHAGEARLGANALGRRGVRAEEVGAACAQGLRRELDARVTLDVHMADQILLYAALAKGLTEFTAREVSGHARTTLWLLPQFLPCVGEALPEGDRVQFQVEPG
jgi:RNA 3'-terminal phosphate cyclase (ATP)